jgi:hypothetical protein
VVCLYNSEFQSKFRAKIRLGVAGKDDFAIWSRKYAFVGKGSNSIFEYEKYFIYYG